MTVRWTVRAATGFAAANRWHGEAVTDVVENACFARDFDLHHNSNLTVPMYAYRFELFVLAAPLTSVSVSKRLF